jgi:hypothetical protein
LSAGTTEAALAQMRVSRLTPDYATLVDPSLPAVGVAQLK